VLLVAQGVQNPGLELGENILVLSYGLQATPWLLLHLSVQYIGNPGSFSFKHVPDAWLFGPQTKLTF
jgi:porin